MIRATSQNAGDTALISNLHQLFQSPCLQSGMAAYETLCVDESHPEHWLRTPEI